MTKEEKNFLFLKWKMWEGWKSKGIPTTKKYLDRAKYELSVVKEMQFTDYFLIIADLISWAKSQGIPCGPGRGCFIPGSRIRVNGMFYKNIEDVHIGDMVQCRTAEWKPVENILEYDVDEEVCLIETEDGSSISGCTKDHEVLCVRREDFEAGNTEPKWVRADSVREGDFLCEHE